MIYYGEFRPSWIDRFLKKIDKTDPSGCWLWRCATNGKAGYGLFYPTLKQKVYAHRFSFLIHNGQIPASMLVCHRCDVPLCVNPAHLFLGTPGDNIRDAYQKGRRRQRRLWKLTDGLVGQIREALGSYREIAARFGVHKSTVGKIKNHRLPYGRPTSADATAGSQ